MLENLFQSAVLGSLALDNRVVMPPMNTYFGTNDGYVTERTRNYYRERARGGAGLIVFEGSMPAYEHPNRHYLTDDSYVDGLRSVTETVHEEGGKVAIQLIPHHGSTDKARPFAPSPLTTPRGEEVRAFERDEVEGLIPAFARGARRAKRAGFDGIEIHAASGYLLHQLFSPLTNDRTDRYGGSLQGRTRLAREFLQAVREAVGTEYPVWFRIAGHEHLDGGLTTEDAIEVAEQLAEAGSDALHVTGGHHWNHGHVPPGFESRALYANAAAQIRAAVDVPVICAGRVNDPEVADEIIDAGKTDLVAMGRAHIADPHFVRKAERGNLDRIRRCVGGLEGCRETKMNPGMTLSCTVNPDVGREGESLEPATEPKTVLVVGGGPAGLEAARIAAQRGHTVDLFEAASALGGQLRWAAHAPAKREYAPLVEFFRSELAAYDVTVHLDTAVDVALIDQLDPDEVVVATGAGFHVPNVEGINAAVERGVVETAETLFAESESLHGPVVILGGNDPGCDLAELLAESGTTSTIVSEDRILEERFQRTGPVDRSYADEMLKRLQDNPRMTLAGRSKVVAVHEDAVEYRTKTGSERVPYEMIALTERSSERSIAQRIEDNRSVTVVGDADQPSGLYPAIHEGADVGRTL